MILVSIKMQIECYFCPVYFVSDFRGKQKLYKWHWEYKSYDSTLLVWMSWRDNEWIRDEWSLAVRPAITLPNNNQQNNPKIYSLCKIASSPLSHVKRDITIQCWELTYSTNTRLELQILNFNTSQKYRVVASKVNKILEHV